MPWTFRPQYEVLLTQRKPGATTGWQSDTRTWKIGTLASFQGQLVTAGVSQATITLHDPTRAIRETIAPRAQNIVEVRLQNRRGSWDTAWTGLVDERRVLHDTTAGHLVELQCSGADKLWEVTSQSGGDVVTLAMAAMQNVPGSEIVKYSARAVGYDPNSITFDPVADSGTGIVPFTATSVTSPDQQKWSAVVEQFLGFSGLEWFFDEKAQGHWRRVGFLGTKAQRMIPCIPLDDILHADIGQGDRQVVTDIEVRWGQIPLTQNASRKSAPPGMASHLGTRRLVVYAPWLRSQPGADYLAATLLDQYASGAATASITVPADPATYKIGTVVQVPAIDGLDGPTWYYISSITYQCVWGETWTATLGLTFGRSPNGTFPYVGNIAYPILTANPQDLPQQVPLLTFDQSNAQKITTPLTVQAQPALSTTQASSSSLPVGTVIELRASAKGGQWVGPSHQYTVVAAPQGQDASVIGLKSGSGTAYATVITYGDGSSSSDSSTSTPISSPSTQAKGTGGGKTTGTTQNLSKPSIFAHRVLAAALTVADNPAGPYHYVLGAAGWDGNWDCSGLVNWAFAQCGVTLPGYGQGLHGMVAADQYYFFYNTHGGRPIPVDQAQIGDLLFHGDLGHIGWKYTDGPDALSYAACAPGVGLRSFTIASELEGGYTLAIDMSGVTPQTIG